MRKTLLFLLLLLCMAQSSFAQTPNHVVISQVYGGGGSTSTSDPSSFKNDFVELYNPTAAAVSLAGWSLQYAGATSAFSATSKLDLSGTIGAGKYFLIQLSGGSGGASLPTPDFITPTTLNMSAGSGKVALVNNTTQLSTNCASGPNIVDLVGYGNSDCFEGVDGTPVISNATAAFRANNGCVDSDNNEADFYEQAPAPRNSASPGHSCAATITVSSITPALFCVDAGSGASGSVTYSVTPALTATFNAYLTDTAGSYANAVLIGSVSGSGTGGTIPVTIPANSFSGTAYRIRVDAASPAVYGMQSNAIEIINGAKNAPAIRAYPDATEASVQWTNPSGCFDELMLVCRQGAAVGGSPSGNGSNYVADASFTGNGTAFGGGKVVYKGPGDKVTVTGLLTGETYFFKLFSRRGSNWSSGVEASTVIRIIPQPGEVLINAFSPRYNTASNEYVELVNTTSKTFDLSDIYLGYQTNVGATRTPSTNLSGTLAPHSFWLLTPASASVTVGKTNGLAANGTSGAGIADDAHIALVRHKDNILIDAVGYGNVSGGTFIEGSAAPAIQNNNRVGGLRRKTDGVDNNNNSADFEVIAPANIDLRNSNSRLANAGAAIAGGTYARLYVTGAASLAGSTTLSEKLVLTNGKLSLGVANLQTAASEGGGTNAYAQTNGTGAYTQLSVGTTPALLPVGNSTYNPLTIANGSGLDWQVRVEDTVRAVHNNAIVKRTWNITPSGTPTAGATLTFQYNEGDAAQLGANFIPDDGLQVWHFGSSNMWQKAGPVQTPAGTAGGIRTVTLSNWTQFSPFVLTSATEVLPIRFDALRLQEQGLQLLLTFTVHNEENIHYYAVESSSDGAHFSQQALIMPRNNSGGTVQYQFTDAAPLSGDRFYRVRAVSVDGDVNFSGVVKTVAKKMTLPMLITPNPVAGNELNYKIGYLAAGSYTVHIWDAAGRLVKTEKLQHAGGFVSGTFYLPPLSKGWHLIEFSGPQKLRQAFTAY